MGAGVERHSGSTRRPDRRSRRSTKSSRDGPALVAIQQVNNETGVIQPLERLADKIRAAGSLLLADCAQSAGKLPLPDADFIAACAHKLGGPPGIGVLLVKDLATLEAGRRAGEGLSSRDAGRCPRRSASRPRWRLGRTTWSVLARFVDRLEEGVKAPGGVVIGEGAPRIADHRRRLRCRARSNAALLVQLDLAGIAVSAGSACSSGKMKASEVLAAMEVAAGDRGQLPSRQLRSVHERSRRRPLPRRVAANSRAEVEAEAA